MSSLVQVRDIVYTARFTCDLETGLYTTIVWAVERKVCGHQTSQVKGGKSDELIFYAILRIQSPKNIDTQT